MLPLTPEIHFGGRFRTLQAVVSHVISASDGNVLSPQELLQNPMKTIPIMWRIMGKVL